MAVRKVECPVPMSFRHTRAAGRPAPQWECRRRLQKVGNKENVRYEVRPWSLFILNSRGVSRERAVRKRFNVQKFGASQWRPVIMQKRSGRVQAADAAMTTAQREYVGVCSL